MYIANLAGLTFGSGSPQMLPSGKDPILLRLFSDAT